MAGAENYPTPKMIARNQEAIDFSRETVVFLVKMARKLFDTLIRLPPDDYLFMNPEEFQCAKDVNEQTTKKLQALMDAAFDLAPVASSDYVFLISYKYKYAGNKFWTDEEWLRHEEYFEEESKALEKDIVGWDKEQQLMFPTDTKVLA